MIDSEIKRKLKEAKDLLAEVQTGCDPGEKLSIVPYEDYYRWSIGTWVKRYCWYKQLKTINKILDDTIEFISMESIY